MAHTHARAAILSVGDELVLGQTADTNARWLAQRLTSVGIIPTEFVTVGDDLAAHVRAYERLGAGVELVISTGGLGPTADDLTREALARATGDTLVEDELAMAQIEAWFASRGSVMRPINRVQAMRPSRGRSIPNLHGTAPGLWAAGGQTGGHPNACDVYCLPGPPREMIPMFESHVLPRLNPPAGTVRTRALHCFGIGESELATRLGPLMDRANNPLVGTTASGGVVSVRMRYTGTLPPGQADALLDGVERQVRSLAGAYVFGAGEDTLASAVVHALQERGLSLVTAESCTGGRLAGLITEVAGASRVLREGFIAYSPDAKKRDLGVEERVFGKDGAGVYSPECAMAMAQGALARTDAAVALATTGIAGPEGGTRQTPVGTVFIALATRAGARDARRFALPGDRASVREWAAKCALGMLWLWLTGNTATRMLRQV